MDKIKIDELMDKELDDLFKMLGDKLSSEEMRQLCDCFNHLSIYLEAYYKIYYETKK